MLVRPLFQLLAARHPTFNTLWEDINVTHRAIFSWRFLHHSWRSAGSPGDAAIPGHPRPSQASTVEDDLGSLALFRPLYALRAPVGGIPWGTRDWQGPGAILVMNPYPHPHPHPHHYSSLPTAQIQFPSGLGISWASKTSKTCSFFGGKIQPGHQEQAFELSGTSIFTP